MSKNVQYIVDAEGHKMAVILPIEEYEEMLEDLHLSRVARERKDEPRRPFAEVLGEMRAEGEIDDRTSEVSIIRVGHRSEFYD